MKKYKKRVCPSCVTLWVDRAVAASAAKLIGTEKRQLIAGLLARRHLLLTGPAGVGKRRLAQALADSFTDGQREQVRTLRGHPWWAAQTGDVTRFVMAQMNYSLWRLEDFISDVATSAAQASQSPTSAEKTFVAVVEQMSRAETDAYFGPFTKQWPASFTPGQAAGQLRIFGTFDADELPVLSGGIERTVATIHLKHAAVAPDRPGQETTGR